ncbi:MAG TPA: amidase domain-containing protein [Plantibacter sp.]|uniref:amidase domain-containing protein n=1 Tax=unclassified Plantibacter TaxID=2624265 RepID=UPI002CEA4B2E|nr:amidase domain-containing protein [Plantibacter sp.]
MLGPGISRRLRASVTVVIVAAAAIGLSGCSPEQIEQRSDDAAIQAQLDYVHAHWDSYNDAEYGALPDSDCVNFASQSLIARGWQMDDDWWFDTDADGDPEYADAWVSSTLFERYLQAHPERATELAATDLTDLQLGDLVQFDWDDSGDEDHTGIVTRIVGDGADRQVYFAGHTLDSHYRSVTNATTVKYPGARVTYWHLAEPTS